MRRYYRLGTMSASAQHVKAAISRTDLYSSFVPLCTASQVLSRPTPNTNLTRLTISFTRFSQPISYVSEVEETYNPDKNSHTIRSICREAPLKYLKSVWSVRSCMAAAEVDYKLEFEFGSILYSLAADLVLQAMGDSLWAAFEKRALELNAYQPAMIKQNTEAKPEVSQQSYNKAAVAINSQNFEEVLCQFLRRHPLVQTRMENNTEYGMEVKHIVKRLMNAPNRETKILNELAIMDLYS